MANAKNTIQNIPLTGELCLNTLKTDVKAFEGYNEKNSTVFGGELSPVWKKESELGDKENSFTIFNSKGEPFTIQLDIGQYSSLAPKLYDKDNNELGYLQVPLIVKDFVPQGALWYTELRQISNIYGRLYISSDGNLYGSFENDPYVLLCNLNLTDFDKIIYGSTVGKIYYNDPTRGRTETIMVSILYVDTSGYVRYRIYCLYGIWGNYGTYAWDFNKYILVQGSLPTTSTESSFAKIESTSDHITINYYPHEGKNGLLYPNMTIVDFTFPQNMDDAPTYTSTDRNMYSDSSVVGYTLRTAEIYPNDAYLVYVNDTYQNVVICRKDFTGVFIRTGHDGNYYIPGIKGDYIASAGGVYYLDGALFAISKAGRLIRLPGQIEERSLTVLSSVVIFRDINGTWYKYLFPTYVGGGFTYNTVHLNSRERQHSKTAWELGVVDKRYVQLCFSIYSDRAKMYDIETNNYFDVNLDYVDTWVPYSNSFSADSVPTPTSEPITTGICYATGWNVNYPITKNSFVSLLMNPKIMTDYPKSVNNENVGGSYASDYYGVDFYYSLGDNVQSAEYQGKNTEFSGTMYPIDTNGNAIYPITWDSQIINGYSNNDLIKIGDTAYPLIYWNNNQKMYAYYLLSSMENVKGAFSLQGQQYTFDDKNIYNVTFDNGVIQNVTAVCYIKNMQFLGTLPTSAVFYSKFNKTFYQFTGDAILSKMFEASDIDEIKMVGQNPSSLSLWICTDKGVYILSDTDMFRLEYDVSDIYFEESKTILITEGETNWIENDISLYDIGNGATETPIKLQTKFYGLGGELKANYDCWYIRLHDKDRKTGKLKLKVNTITNSSFETEEKTFTIEPNQYDSNNTVYIRYQPKYQTAVATQLELESDIAIYQLSLGVNSTDAVAQQSKFNF